MLMSETNDFKTFFNAFLECALWSSVDDSNEFIDDNYSIDDINERGLELLKAYALSFFSQCWYYAKNAPCRDFSDLGHDLWLTACGLGAGFWDGDWPKYGDILDKLAKQYNCLEHIYLMEFIEK